jgi:hypothetical protein
MLKLAVTKSTGLDVLKHARSSCSARQRSQSAWIVFHKSNVTCRCSLRVSQLATVLK